MIRFINLTGQILIDDPIVHFAWYDTIISQFMEFDDSQDWNTWKEFETDLLQHCHNHNMSSEVTARCLLRFRNLYPPTVLFMEGYKEPEELKNYPTNSVPSSKE
ncbi:MAG TPA: hypothetical protein ENI23_09230 [bacterium]|nr:hypothetical protein [bacterium]